MGIDQPEAVNPACLPRNALQPFIRKKCARRPEVLGQRGLSIARCLGDRRGDPYFNFPRDESLI